MREKRAQVSLLTTIFIISIVLAVGFFLWNFTASLSQVLRIQGTEELNDKLKLLRARISTDYVFYPAGEARLRNIGNEPIVVYRLIVYNNGSLVWDSGISEIARMGIGRTFQITRPFKNLTVLQNVMAACGRDAYFGLSFFRKYRTPKVVEEAMSIIEDVGLADYADQPAKVLPIGHMRRLEIARALALRPRLLLLDEPTAGMSAKEIEEISELVRRLRDEKGITIMLVEHNMRVAMGLSDRMYVLNYGKVIAEGTPEEVRENPLVIEAYLGRGYAAGS